MSHSSNLVAPRPRRWKLAGGSELSLGGRTLVMGILNVTPDSFFDGGCFNDTDGGLDSEKAIAHGLRMAAAGADIIDVGGESTRPGAAPVAAAEELERTIPVVAGLVRRCPVPISIDTTRAVVARAALGKGARIINDISGFTADSAMPGLAVESGAGLVVMHIRGTPRTMQENPHYDDTCADVRQELEERVRLLREAGVEPGRIVIDPGIGFGKTVEDNLRLLRNLCDLGAGYPLLVGCSRKSLLGAISGRKVHDRLVETVATSVLAAASGCSIVRVHDVEENRRALAVVEAVLTAGF
jgi:dihydropteroate synthase